jgi:hypothetical protein
LTHPHDLSFESHPSGLTEDQIENLEAQFAEQQTIVNLCCIPSGLTFLFVAHASFVAISQSLMNSDGISGFRVPYQPVIYWFMAGFGALSLCFEITLQIWALFIGHTIVNLYADWDSRQPKKSRGGITYYDARSVLRWLSLLITLPIGLLSALALNMHTTFGDNNIHEFGYAFGAPRVYPYAAIRQVTHVHGVFNKHSKLVAHPYCVIDFADGHRWNQNNWDGSSAATERTIQAIMRRHTNLSFADILVIEDLPSPSH